MFTTRRSVWLTGAMVGAWVVLSLAWSTYLIYAATRQAVRARMRHETLGLAAVLQRHPPPQRDRFHSYLTWATQQMPTLARDCRAIDHLRYVIIWNRSGVVELLAQRQKGALVLRRSIVDSALPAAQWPALAATRAVRFRRLTRAPWNAASPTPLLDATGHLHYGQHYSGYISLGFPQKIAWAAFWKARRLLESAVAATLAGVVLLLLGARLAVRQLGINRNRQEQASRARTSLLSERGMLASVLAHEVRSPLTALQFNLHTLRGLLEKAPDGNPRQLELTSLCEREIRRLDLMLNDFLQRTQVVSPLEFTAVNQVVREALDFLKPAMERRNIRIITHLEPSDPKVQINADELRQVMLNLCANAQEAMPRGGTLVVSTVSEEASVALLVRDSGTGITPEVQKRLFEPFFTTKAQGSGLGLALVRRVVSGGGGKVFCESQPGEGATFRIVLPRGDTEHRAHAKPPREPSLQDSFAAWDAITEEGQLPPEQAAGD